MAFRKCAQYYTHIDLQKIRKEKTEEFREIYRQYESKFFTKAEAKKVWEEFGRNKIFPTMRNDEECIENMVNKKACKIYEK